MALGGVTRGISIALSLATQGFNAGLNSASGALNNFARSADDNLRDVGLAAGAMSAALAVGLGVAVNAAMNFEAEMSNVGAVSGATGASFNALREQALQLGADTAFTATEVAVAQAELAKAGVSTANILGGALEGALSLAAASNVDLAQAAEIAAQAMNTFGLSGRDVPHIADVIAAAANKSAADVGDMGLALKQSGAAAKMAGLDLEETAAALSIFANSGMKGSDAGTSLKTMLTRLSSPTEEARATMDALGISFTKADGNMKDLAGISEELRVGLGRLTTDTERSAAITTLFGSDAQRAGFFLAEAGSKGVNYWTEQVGESGYAAEVARRKMDNLRGDLEKLGGSIETVLIGAGSEANGVLRSTIQVTTNLVNAVGELPGPVQTAGVGITGLALGATALVAGFGTFIPMARNVKGALEGMGGAAGTLGSAMSMRNFVGLGIAATAAIVPIAILTNSMQSAKQKAKETADQFAATFTPPVTLDDFDRQITATIARWGQAWNKYQGAAGNNWLNQGSMRVWEGLNPIGEDTFTETEQLLHELEDQLTSLQAQARISGDVIHGLGEEFGWSEEQIRKFADTNAIDLQGAIDGVVLRAGDYGNALDKMMMSQVFTGQELDNNLTPAMKAAQEVANSAPSAIGDLEAAITAAGDEALTASERFDAFKEAVDLAIGFARDPAAAQREFTEAIWEARDAAAALNAETWHGFNQNTPAAFAYQDAMDGVLEAYGEEITLAQQRGASQQEMDAINWKVIDSIAQMGREGILSADEVAYLHGQIAAIPFQSDKHISVHTGDAEAAVDRLGSKIASLARNALGMGLPSLGFGMANGGILAFADGGHHAQIARGGPTRIWNEPETGGESYIPWAQSKRGRSVEILRQTNAGFGNPLGVGGGGGGIGSIHVTVNAPGVYDSRGLAEQIRRDGALQDAVATAVVRSSGARDGAR
jgi:TP901 family phage tail tape measure protein